MIPSSFFILLIIFTLSYAFEMCEIYKNENKKVAMASTTKIMTAIIVIESGKLEDEVTVSAKAGGIGGSRLGLKKNDKITVRNLLYGLMLCSGNDAAIALAEHICRRC